MILENVPPESFTLSDASAPAIILGTVNWDPSCISAPTLLLNLSVQSSHVSGGQILPKYGIFILPSVPLAGDLWNSILPDVQVLAGNTPGYVTLTASNTIPNPSAPRVVVFAVDPYSISSASLTPTNYSYKFFSVTVPDCDASPCDCLTFNTTGVTAFADHLALTFSDNIILSGPGLDVGSWYVTIDGPGKPVEVGSVLFSGNTVTLGVTPQTLNADYVLHIPTAGISTADFKAFTGLWSIPFLGVPTPVNVQMIRAVDTHHIDVIFAIAVDEATASDPTNYTLNHGLTVTAATKVTDFWYTLTNAPRQVDGTNYTLIVSNVEPK